MSWTTEAVADRVGSVVGGLSLPVLALGLYLGLFWAPPDAAMGDVQRLMYVHFPSWIATGMGYVVGLGTSILYLATRDLRWDQWAVAGVEVGVVFNLSGLLTGSIWGRPTWGVWWTWDPRLTTTAIMLLTFAGYLALRAFLDDPHRRARVSALVAIIGFVNLPIVYFSVRWWRTLHQVQSSPETVDPPMALALRVMMAGFALLGAYLIARRYRLAALEHSEEVLVEEDADG